MDWRGLAFSVWWGIYILTLCFPTNFTLYFYQLAHGRKERNLFNRPFIYCMYFLNTFSSSLSFLLDECTGSIFCSSLRRWFLIGWFSWIHSFCWRKLQLWVLQCLLHCSCNGKHCQDSLTLLSFFKWISVRCSA